MRPEDEIEETKKETAPESAKDAAEETSGEVSEEAVEETAEESKGRNYWWLALSFLFLFLAGGGYYALTSMGKEAQKLAGGDSYNQLSANSAAYSKGALQKADNYFSSDETDPMAAKIENSQAASAQERKGLEARGLLRGGGAAGSGSAGVAAGGGETEQEEAAPSAGGAARSGAFEGKLEARASGLAGLRGGGVPKTSSGFSAGGEQSAGGAAVTAGRPSVQRETGTGAPQKSAPGGVLDALKGAFRASFYGARIASHDSARHWLARSFDNTPQANTSLEYDEKVKAKLDRIDPNSIPKFLRDQDISAAEAKTLASADVGKPKMDVEGTKEALKNDADYQAKKMAKDMASAAMNPLGNLVGGNTARATDPNETSGTGNENDGRGVQNFADPEDEAAFGQIAVEEFISTEGYGAECGCTQQAPCCCLPQNSATGNCPLYGPFLPNDPCGAAIYGNNGTGLVGDFPPPNMSQMPA